MEAVELEGIAMIAKLPMIRIKRSRPMEPAAVMNHLMFVTLAFFMIQQQLIAPSPAMSSGPWVAQALHYQPRTPPPMLDPEEIYTEEMAAE